MPARSVRIWLSDIREEIAEIRKLTEHTNAASFAANWAMKRAVQHALLIIAEAAKHVPAELKNQRPKVPWKKMHGVGDMLRHEYRRIEPDILWSVVKDHLEDLDEAAKFFDSLPE